ncbi:MAG: hypothetical protein RSC98_06375, partial [Clostridia bacterium]
MPLGTGATIILHIPTILLTAEAIDNSSKPGYNTAVTLKKGTHVAPSAALALAASRCALCYFKDFSFFFLGKWLCKPMKGEATMADQEKKVILTRDGYHKLEKELDYYISVRRNEISEQIAIARGFGDLSENAEYDEAKNEQSRIEAKIVEMENALRNCVIVEDDEVNTEMIGVG